MTRKEIFDRVFDSVYDSVFTMTGNDPDVLDDELEIMWDEDVTDSEIVVETKITITPKQSAKKCRVKRLIGVA